MEQSGPEITAELAKITEEEIKSFFQDFCKWKFLTKASDVGFESSNDEGTVPIDLLFYHYCPFKDQNEVVLIQVKNYDKISNSILNKHISKLKKDQNHMALSAPFKKDFRISQLGSYNFTNSIIVYKLKSYDGFNRAKILNSIELKDRVISGNPTIIQYMDNFELSRFYYFNETYCKKMKVRYFYPRYLKNERPKSLDLLSLIYLQSDFILGTLSLGQDERNFIFYLNEPAIEMFSFFTDIADKFNFPIDLAILGNAEIESLTTYQKWGDSYKSKESIKEIPSLEILNQDKLIKVDLVKGFTNAN